MSYREYTEYDHNANNNSISPVLVSSALDLIRRLSEQYGAEKGMEIWTHFSEVVDDDLRLEVFKGMLSGMVDTDRGIGAYGTVTVPTVTNSKIMMIKAVRRVSAMGLKSAKEAVESVMGGRPVRFFIRTDIDPDSNTPVMTEESAMQTLEEAGLKAELL